MDELTLLGTIEILLIVVVSFWGMCYTFLLRKSVYEPMYLAGSEGFEPSTWRLGGVRAIHYTPVTTS